MPAMHSGAVTSRPLTTMPPALGRHSPVTTFIKVDLPHPEGPTTATNSRSRTASVVPCSASVPSPSSPYRNDTRSRWTKLVTAALDRSRGGARRSLQQALGEHRVDPFDAFEGLRHG